MIKIKSWPKLIFSIILAQSAGLVGTIFTLDAIPTWYALLNKPSFSPPNWIFGPVWTVLYTLIGISLYLIWTNKKGSLKLFLFHLFLNAIWSPIFFGAKNLGLAFIVILIMDLTLIIIIKNFYKLNKIAALILIPYLMWISFASLLNYSIWKLNHQNLVKNIFAQDFTFAKSREDYVFASDNYRTSLSDFNLKRGAYKKNPTLSLKEELRISIFKFSASRNNLLKVYLTMLRLKTYESLGLETSEKENILSKLDSEISWYDNRKNSYNQNDKLEDIVNKTKDEDSRYETDTKPTIYLTLSTNSLGDVIDIKNKHIKLYQKLKAEAQNLINLGRADENLFDRWFNDINNELDMVKNNEVVTRKEIGKIFGADTYLRNGAYQKSIDQVSGSKSSLFKINEYILELENAIADKR